ncbi:MAG: ABC transporter substrate-binding protein [Burkholderiaceae bacterium]|nr:ABC transporter substrate-binding protein [Burkholderiaceae bacterium]
MQAQNRLLKCAWLAVLAGLLVAGAQAAQCGRVTIANMNWQSAEVLAHIDHIILKEGYGCDAELVPGDTMPTLMSMMGKGQPDVAPEAWVNAMRGPLDSAVAAGRLHYAGKSLSDGGIQGWWIPKYVADAHPEIKTLEDALKRPDLFPAADDSSKGAVHNCPSGWNCEIITRNLFKAFKAARKGFVLVDTGSAAGLAGSIAKAYERKQGWLGYYWSPTAILGKYAMVRLGAGVEHDEKSWNDCTVKADCADPQPNDFPAAEVYTLVTSSFRESAGPAYEYLARRRWDNDTVNKLLEWMQVNQATGRDGALHFLQSNDELWTRWVDDFAARKIKDSL